MAFHRVQPVSPRGEASPLSIQRDADLLESVRRDAAAMAFGGALGVLLPRNEASLVAWLQDCPSERVIVQGALSGLTGGAAPDHEVVISTRRLGAMECDESGLRMRVEPGLVLATLQEALAERGLWYPPAPTHDGATIGGNVATNAAGAATFKYGTTRDWVEELRVVLRDGRVLALHRGQVIAAPGDTVIIEGEPPSSIPIPTYLSPSLRKTSAGYRVSDPLDLVDLFIGAEGTLGIITQVTLRVVRRPQVLAGFMLLPDLASACAITADLRDSAARGGLDIRSIEVFDGRCIRFLAEQDRLKDLGSHDVAGAGAALLFEAEISASPADLAAVERELVEILGIHGVLEACEVAMPADRSRRSQLLAIREAVPLSISEWLVRRQREDPSIRKVGGDVIVPFEALAGFLVRARALFEERGLDLAIFGHISDGNLHPNVLPRDGDEVRRACQAQLDLGDLVQSLGGCPVSEHGVGRSLLKKSLLTRFWGDGPIAEMRAVKMALDPGFTLGRGVLFDPL